MKCMVLSPDGGLIFTLHPVLVVNMLNDFQYFIKKKW